MHGNVWEWCEDYWHNNYDGAPTDDRAWLSGNSNIKVVRSGSWISVSNYCRSACRFIDIPYYSTDDYGFRVAFSMP